ncbi:MAG: hypothetical protein LBS00_05095 [Synergistaceae bacterium]|nr:hypothetical protein [Synergistaceae bacterium]
MQDIDCRTKSLQGLFGKPNQRRFPHTQIHLTLYAVFLRSLISDFFLALKHLSFVAQNERENIRKRQIEHIKDITGGDYPV